MESFLNCKILFNSWIFLFKSDIIFLSKVIISSQIIRNKIYIPYEAEQNGKDFCDTTLPLLTSEEKIKELNEDLNDYNNFPKRDGYILIGDLYDAYKSGKGKDIDMLLGSNKDELR